MIDLHCHSTASDGTVNPCDLPRLAANMGLHGLALTDHDTLAGLDAFLEAAGEFPGLECIPGIELAGTAACGEHMHIIGLFIDSHSPALQEISESQEAARQVRNQLILEKLAALGKTLTMEDVTSLVPPGTVIGRPHIANALVKRKYCTNSRQAFDKYIGRGKPAYAGRMLPTAPQCIAAIHDAGGLAIWAHPMTSGSMTLSKCRSRLKELSQSSLDGIEAYYPEHTPVKTLHVKKLAEEFGLLISGGTDFHGLNLPRIQLGHGYGGNYHVPDALLDCMHRRLGR